MCYLFLFNYFNKWKIKKIWQWYSNKHVFKCSKMNKKKQIRSKYCDLLYFFNVFLLIMLFLIFFIYLLLLLLF
jgi:hypothetical protein